MKKTQNQMKNWSILIQPQTKDAPTTLPKSLPEPTKMRYQYKKNWQGGILTFLCSGAILAPRSAKTQRIRPLAKQIPTCRPNLGEKSTLNRPRIMSYPHRTFTALLYDFISFFIRFWDVVDMVFTFIDSCIDSFISSFMESFMNASIVLYPRLRQQPAIALGHLQGIDLVIIFGRPKPSKINKNNKSFNPFYMPQRCGGLLAQPWVHEKSIKNLSNMIEKPSKNLFNIYQNP